VFQNTLLSRESVVVARESHKLTDGRFDSSSRNQIQFHSRSAVDQRTVNPCVGGSIPPCGANYKEIIMPWIQNVSLSDIRKGHHVAVKENSMLIQIVDPAMEFPTPAQEFKEVHQFEFLDLEKSDDSINDDWKISDAQAAELVRLLQHALENRMDVVVHCVAGICRSGAVCEVGVMMGFQDTEVFRSPNLLVKHKMMKCLGWTYDENEPHTINGVAVSEDWTNDNEKVFTLAAERRERRLREGDI